MVQIPVVTHRVSRDIFVSLQTKLFDSPYAFSEKDDFLTKSMSPMVCSRSEYKVYCYGFTTFGHLGNHFTMVVSNFVCYPLLVDETVKSFYAMIVLGLVF